MMQRALLVFCFLLLGLSSLKSNQDSLYKARYQKVSAAQMVMWQQGTTAYITQLTSAQKTDFQAALGRAEYYFPYLDSVLKANQLPVELKYYALGNSLLQFNYFDASNGARGIWAFNYGNAKLHGLQISSYVDERRNVQKASLAFVKAIKEYHKLYKSWPLALAAFASSATKVNRAIALNQNQSSFELIQKDLSPEAQTAIKRFVAAAYLFQYKTEHKLKPLEFNYPTAAIVVYTPNWYSLEKLAAQSKVSIGVLEFLNPEYKRLIIPAGKEEKPLVLPKSLADSVEWVLRLKFKPYQHAQAHQNQGEEQELEGKVHVVAAGETLDSLAVLYKCTKQNIISWNALVSDTLAIGQELIIAAEEQEDKPTQEPKVVAKPTSKPASKPAVANPRYYSVRSGDTLSGIAKKHGCTVAQLKKWNNLNSDSIKPGQKLKVSP